MAFPPIHFILSQHISLYRVVNGERLQLLPKTTTTENKSGQTNTTVTALTSKADDNKNADNSDSNDIVVEPPY